MNETLRCPVCEATYDGAIEACPLDGGRLTPVSDAGWLGRVLVARFFGGLPQCRARQQLAREAAREDRAGYNPESLPVTRQDCALSGLWSSIEPMEKFRLEQKVSHSP